MPRIMDGMNEPRTTRASKRRRISSPPQPPPLETRQPARSTSPDELASGPPTPYAVSRHASTPTIVQNSEPRRPSFSPVSDTSYDELDHTANVHTLYRTQEPPTFRRSFSERARLQPNGVGLRPGQGPQVRPLSPETPEYSRLSTPVASPPPPQAEEKVLREANFVPYGCARVMRGHKKGVAAVKISPDGRMIGSCCGYTHGNETDTQGALRYAN